MSRQKIIQIGRTPGKSTTLLIDVLLEKYIGNVKETWKKPDKQNADVFINPSPKELKEILAGRDEMRIILPNDKDFVAFDVFTLHESVRRQLNIRTGITLQGYVYGKELSVMVTDNVKHTLWDENPEAADFIRNNKYINKKFKLGDITYYNDMIVGDWEEL